LYFTKYDLDILAWVNMLKENQMSPATWIQAVIVSESKKSRLDIGSVVPVPPPPPKPSLFGDDTKPTSAYVVGSRLNIRVTRGIVQEALRQIVGENEMTAPIIKMILRKNIGFLSQPPNIPPDPAQLRDFFVRGVGCAIPVQIPKEIRQERPPANIPAKNPKKEKKMNPLLAYIN